MDSGLGTRIGVSFLLGRAGSAKTAQMSFAAMARDTFSEFLNCRIRDHLRKDSPTRVHASSIRTSKNGF